MHFPQFLFHENCRRFPLHGAGGSSVVPLCTLQLMPSSGAVSTFLLVPWFHSQVVSVWLAVVRAQIISRRYSQVSLAKSAFSHVRSKFARNRPMSSPTLSSCIRSFILKMKKASSRGWHQQGRMTLPFPAISGAASSDHLATVQYFCAYNPHPTFCRRVKKKNTSPCTSRTFYM